MRRSKKPRLRLRLKRWIDTRTASRAPSSGNLRVLQQGDALGGKVAVISTFWGLGLPILTPFALGAALAGIGFSVIIVATTGGPPDPPAIAARLKALTFDVSPLTIIWRRNVGKDFGGFKDILSHHDRELDQAEMLFLGNDSLIGPLFPSDYFAMLNDAGPGMWGPTECFERSYHLQSSHLLFSGRAACDAARAFFRAYRCYRDRENIIARGEVGLSKWMVRAQHPLRAFYPMARLVGRDAHWDREEKARPLLLGVNPQHHYFEALLEERFPFVKRELLVSNPDLLPCVLPRVLKHIAGRDPAGDLLFQHFRPV